jgi:phage terminase small subunit
MKLTVKQELFVSEYLIDGNGARAAREAGYAATSGADSVTACRLLRNNRVMTEIQDRQQVVAHELRITLQDVLADLLEAVQIAREQRNPAAMISGAREVGKLLGFYTPEVQKVEVSFDGRGLWRKYEAMSDAELIAIIDGTYTA